MLDVLLLVTVFPMIITGFIDLPPADNVELVVAVFRHGDRNPILFFPDDPNKGKWGFEGVAELTNIGKMQAYVLGNMMRDRYSKMLDPHFLPKQFTATSSSSSRCQMTMQAFLAGLYPPIDWSMWNANLNWQPIPIGLNDELLQTKKIDDCVVQKEAWNAATSTKNPVAKKLLENNKDLVDFVSEKTGWNKSALSIMDDAANALLAMEIRNLTFPDWATQNNPWNTNIYKNISTFTEGPPLLCAADQKCRHMIAGNLLGHIVRNVQEKRVGNLNASMFAYSTHNENVNPLLRLLGITKEHGIYYNAAVILEYRSKPEPAVRLIFSEPLKTDPTKRESSTETMPFCNANEWCPLDSFVNGVKDQAIDDFKKACRYPVCLCVPAEKQQKK